MRGSTVHPESSGLPRWLSVSRFQCRDQVGELSSLGCRAAKAAATEACAPQRRAGTARRAWLLSMGSLLDLPSPSLTTNTSSTNSRHWDRRQDALSPTEADGLSGEMSTQTPTNTQPCGRWVRGHEKAAHIRQSTESPEGPTGQPRRV